MVTAESFIAEIDAFLAASGMSPTAFGKAAVGDPSFVSDLKSGGRTPGLRLVDKVNEYIRVQTKPEPDSADAAAEAAE